MTVKTHFEFPPIPDRSLDWTAWLDQYGADCSPIGRGATEVDALLDLLDNCDDPEDAAEVQTVLDEQDAAS